MWARGGINGRCRGHENKAFKSHTGVASPGTKPPPIDSWWSFRSHLALFILTVDKTLATLFLPFLVNIKLEARGGGSGWRKAIRRYTDSSKKGCPGWDRRMQTERLLTRGGNWAEWTEEPSVLFLTTASAPTIFSIKISVKTEKKHGWLKPCGVEAELKQEGWTLVLEGSCVIVVHCNDPESPTKKVRFIIHWFTMLSLRRGEVWTILQNDLHTGVFVREASEHPSMMSSCFMR